MSLVQTIDVCQKCRRAIDSLHDWSSCLERSAELEERALAHARRRQEREACKAAAIAAEITEQEALRQQLKHFERLGVGNCLEAA